MRRARPASACPNKTTHPVPLQDCPRASRLRVSLLSAYRWQSRRACWRPLAAAAPSQDLIVCRAQAVSRAAFSPSPIGPEYPIAPPPGHSTPASGRPSRLPYGGGRQDVAAPMRLANSPPVITCFRSCLVAHGSKRVQRALVTGPKSRLPCSHISYVMRCTYVTLEDMRHMREDQEL